MRRGEKARERTERARTVDKACGTGFVKGIVKALWIAGVVVKFFQDSTDIWVGGSNYSRCSGSELAFFKERVNEVDKILRYD